MKVAFHTLGCKVNQYETEAMKEQFTSKGFELVNEDEFADCYIVNTCTVTNLADRKSRQYIRRMKKLNPDAVLVVTGCYSQVSKEDLISMPEVDIVTGNGVKQDIISLVEDFLNDKEKIVHMKSYDELNSYQDSGIITSMDSRTRAYIKIQEGCNRFCAYCLIPYARGKARSRDPEEILEEAKSLLNQGFKELVLTGINTALYGNEVDFKEKFEPWLKAKDLEELSGVEVIINAIDKLPGDFRIRLSSLEPAVVNSEYVKRLLKYKKLCHHLHLSAQSGSDNVLKLMNRPYSREEYLDIVRVLREEDKTYGITTDIIVGFPGESDEDFSDSMKLIEEAKFSKVHAFRYSKRKGTKAAELPDHIDSKVKNFRSDALIKKADEVSDGFIESLSGIEEIVLTEEREGKYITGYTGNYIKAYIEDKDELVKENSFIKVKLLVKYKEGMLATIC